jgi:ABC-type amino acid transport substrate-binding protein
MDRKLRETLHLMKNTNFSAIFIGFMLLSVIFSGCQRIQRVAVEEKMTVRNACTAAPRVVNFGFYAYFAPVSYSADPNPASDEFNMHHGYEADLLTALEAMEDIGISFTRKAIGQWPGIWLKAAEPAYDLIGGGITILKARTLDAAGIQRVTFTSGHIQFRQSLLVRREDAQRLTDYTALSRDVRVGVLAGTTGEARLLQRTGIVNDAGILIEGTRIETSAGILVSDGTSDYTITSAAVAPQLIGRRTLYPPSADMPEVIYLGDTKGESELLQALTDGRIDAVARGEVGNREAAITNAAFVVSAFDDQVEYGGFTLAIEDAELAACLNARLKYLTDAGNIGYAQWLQDPTVFFARAQVWNASQQPDN